MLASRKLYEYIAIIIYRYMRLNNLRTVGDWERLVDILADRKTKHRNSYHWARGNLSLGYPTEKLHKPIRFLFYKNGECYGASYMFDKDSILNRYEKLLIIKKRIERNIIKQAEYMDFVDSVTCGVCGKVDYMNNSTTGVCYRGLYDSSTLKHKVNFAQYMCVSCWNKAKPISKRLQEIDKDRIFLNNIKRELKNEQNNHDNRSNA